MFSILSGTNSFIANVSTSNQLLKSNPSNSSNGNPSYTGNYVSRVCEQDAGIVLGEPRQLQSETSAYYRKYVSKSCIIHYTKFGSQNMNASDLTSNGTLSYTDKWRILSAIFSTTTFNGSIILNSGGTTTSVGNGACISSYQTFSFQISIPIEMEVIAKYVSNKPNTVTETIIGFAIYTTGISSTSASVNTGVYFKYTQGSILYGCITCNGVDYMTEVLQTPEMSVNHTYKIVVSNSTVNFIIDGIYQASITSPFIYQMTSVPISCRSSVLVNTSYVSTLEILSIVVSVTDINTYKPWPHIMSAVNNRISTFPNSTIGVIAISNTNGSTANYTNSMTITNITLANTSLFIPRFGGQATILPTTNNITDGILLGSDNICNSTSANINSGLSNKNFVIMGMTLQGCITTTLSTGVIYLYEFCYGANTIGLSATNNNANVKGNRRIPIGVDVAFTTVSVGTLGNEFKLSFNPPVVLNVNEFIFISARNIAGVTTTGAITYLVSFDGYWE